MIRQKRSLLAATALLAFLACGMTACSSQPVNSGVAYQTQKQQEKNAIETQAESRLEQQKINRMMDDTRTAFRSGKHVHVQADPPFGMRSGAHSRSYLSGDHGEIPPNIPMDNYGHGTLAAYDDMHSSESTMFFEGAAANVYKGEMLLPAGSWTGEPLETSTGYTRQAWHNDARGRLEPGEVSGQSMIVQSH